MLAKRRNNSEIRTLIDDRNEKAGKKIRDAEVKKIPYMLVVGDKEMETGTVAVRDRKEGDKGTMQFEDFLSHIIKEIDNWQEKLRLLPRLYFVKNWTAIRHSLKNR